MRTHAISKRVLSLMLALMLVLGMLPVFAAAADTTTIYFDNTAGWTKINAYMWDAGGNPLVGWPGGSMTLVEGSIYSVEVPAGYPNIIFNNGSGTQTKDLKVPTDGKNLFTYSSLTWGTYVPTTDCTHVWDKGTFITAPTCTTEGDANYTCTLCGAKNAAGVPALGHDFVENVCTRCGVNEFRTVYFQNTEGWSSVNAYMWESNGNAIVAWPGTAMTAVAGGYWSIQVPQNAANIIFNGDGKQTADLVLNDAYDLYVYGGDWGTYDPEACAHVWDEGVVVTEATCVTEGEVIYTCTLCDNTRSVETPVAGHSYVNRICVVCGAEKPVLDFYLVGYINGADYGCNGDWENMGEYKFVDGKLIATFTENSYVYVKTEGNANWYLTEAYCTDTTATLVENASEKMLVPGNVELTFTLVENDDGTLTLSYATAVPVCKHPNHSTEGLCTDCGEAVDHSYTEGVCTVCGAQEPATIYYLLGYLNGSDYVGTDYAFVDGVLNVKFTSDSYIYIGSSIGVEFMAKEYISGDAGTFYVKGDGIGEKMFIPGGLDIALTLVENGDGSLSISYTTSGEICQHPSHSTEGICSDCGKAVEHTYSDGSCTVCGVAAPVVDFYLVGYINGADYGCNDDWENLGEYKFVNGKLVATFATDSYVFVKDNVGGWFLAEAYCTDTTCTLVPNAAEKMFVPGGVELTFTVVENGDGTLTLSYATGNSGYAVSGTITSYGNDADDVVIELLQDGAVVYTTTVTGKSAAYSIEGVVAGVYTLKISKNNHAALSVEITVDGDAAQDATIFQKGDVNGDGKVNMKDWSRLYDHVSKVNALTDYALSCADVNGDGKVNMKDWSRLYDHLSKVNPLW